MKSIMGTRLLKPLTFMYCLFFIFAYFNKPVFALTLEPESFSGSQFEAQSNGTMIHSYTFRGHKEQKNYKDQKSVQSSRFIIGATSFTRDESFYVYTMDTPYTHTQTLKWIGGPKTIESKWYLVIRHEGSDYKTLGIFYYSKCFNTAVCGTGNEDREYYFKTREFSFGSHDDPECYKTLPAEFVSYLDYVNSRAYTVNNLGSGENSLHPFFIKGKVDIDYEGQIVGTEKGKQPWPSDKIEGGVRAQLWYKGPRSVMWERVAEEWATVESDGSYQFDKKARATGSYIVSVLLIRSAGTLKMKGIVIDTVETAGDKVTVPSEVYDTLFADRSSQEGFFGTSQVIQVEKNTTDITNANFTLSSIGIKRQPEDEQSPCEQEAKCGTIIGGIFSGTTIKVILCKIGCVFYEFASDIIKWAMGWLDTATGISKNFFAPQKAYAMTPTTQVLNDVKIRAGWNYSLVITDIIVIAALLLIAFANILKRVKLEFSAKSRGGLL